jgi:hypothetical protein
MLLPLTEKRGDTWIEPDSAVRAAAGHIDPVDRAATGLG